MSAKVVANIDILLMQKYVHSLCMTITKAQPQFLFCLLYGKCQVCFRTTPQICYHIGA